MSAETTDAPLFTAMLSDELARTVADPRSPHFIGHRLAAAVASKSSDELVANAMTSGHEDPAENYRRMAELIEEAAAAWVEQIRMMEHAALGARAVAAMLEGPAEGEAVN